MFRVLFDTNVLVAAATSPAGPCNTLILRWSAGDFEPVVSPRLLDELERVLMRPKFAGRIEPGDVIRYVGLLRHRCMLLPDMAYPPKVSRDTDDDYIFALAVIGEVQVIISGDRDLLEVADPPVPVVTPRSFLESLGP